MPRLGAQVYGFAAVTIGVFQHAALAAMIAGAASFSGPGLFDRLISQADPDTPAAWLVLLAGSAVQALLAFVRARTVGRTGFVVMWAALPM